RALVAPVYQSIVAALPVPTGAPVDPSCTSPQPCGARLTASYANPTRFDAFSLRLDQTVRPGLTFFGRFSHTPSTTANRSFSNVASSSRNTDLVTAGMTTVLSPSLVSDLRAGWGRATGRVELSQDSAFGPTPPALSSLFRPGASPEADHESVRLPDGTPIDVGTRTNNASWQVNLVDTWSLIRGAHDINLGLDYRFLEAASRASTGYIVL